MFLPVVNRAKGVPRAGGDRRFSKALNYKLLRWSLNDQSDDVAKRIKILAMRVWYKPYTCGKFAIANNFQGKSGVFS